VPLNTRDLVVTVTVTIGVTVVACVIAIPAATSTAGAGRSIVAVEVRVDWGSINMWNWGDVCMRHSICIRMRPKNLEVDVDRRSVNVPAVRGVDVIGNNGIDVRAHSSLQI